MQKQTVMKMWKHKFKNNRRYKCINTNVKAEGDDVEINVGWQET
jgi:hypothetical protein